MLSIYDYDDIADLKLIAFAAKNIARKATVPSPGSFAMSTGRFRTFSHFEQKRRSGSAMDSVESASCKQHLEKRKNEGFTQDSWNVRIDFDER